MEKEFREKFSGRVLSGYGGDGMYLHPTGSGYPLMPELKSFLLANNDKLAQVITAELIRKMEEVEVKDISYDADMVTETGRAIMWHQNAGWNLARKIMLNKAREMLSE